jgi:hypothetical protein
MGIENRCSNRTLMAARCAVLQDHRGSERLVAVAKMTYELGAGGSPAVAAEPVDVRLFDVPWFADPGSSIRYPSDLVDTKPGTDVLMVGTAHGSRRDGVSHVDVSLRLAARDRLLDKRIRVHGRRPWVLGAGGVVPGHAAAFEPAALAYELAFGGVDAADPGAVLQDDQNPVGTGIARDRGRLVGTAAPRLERLEAPLASARPGVAGFGPIASHWAPRANRAGTHDESWRRSRAPVRPVDFDPRHHCVAPDDQWLAVPLEGDEAVEIVGAAPREVLRFQLPRYAPRFAAVRDGSVTALPTHLDTYLIDTDARRVELTWRASVPLHRRERLDAVTIRTDDWMPADLLLPAARRRGLAS